MEKSIEVRRAPAPSPHALCYHRSFFFCASLFLFHSSSLHHHCASVFLRCTPYIATSRVVAAITPCRHTSLHIATPTHRHTSPHMALCGVCDLPG